MDTRMCAWLCLSVCRCCRGSGACGGREEAFRLPPTVSVAVSLRASTTQPCSVTSSAPSSPFSESLTLSPTYLACLYRSPWTLAVAVVLLPVIVQLLSSLTEPMQLAVLTGALEMVVQRFSPSILACKSEKPSLHSQAESKNSPCF